MRMSDGMNKATTYLLTSILHEVNAWIVLGTTLKSSVVVQAWR